MSKKPESPRDRLKAMSLLHWGGILIFAGIVANVVMSMAPTPGDSAAARGQAFGRGLATVLAIVAGVVLIIIHFVRGARR